MNRLQTNQVNVESGGVEAEVESGGLRYGTHANRIGTNVESSGGWFKKDVVPSNEAWTELIPFLSVEAPIGPFEQRGWSSLIHCEINSRHSRCYIYQ